MVADFVGAPLLSASRKPRPSWRFADFWPDPTNEPGRLLVNVSRLELMPGGKDQADVFSGQQVGNQLIVRAAGSSDSATAYGLTTWTAHMNSRLRKWPNIPRRIRRLPAYK
jgi:hypothetical protein